MIKSIVTFIFGSFITYFSLGIASQFYVLNLRKQAVKAPLEKQINYKDINYKNSKTVKFLVTYNLFTNIFPLFYIKD